MSTDSGQPDPQYVRLHTVTAGVALSLILHLGAVGVLAVAGTHAIVPGSGELSQLDLTQAFALPPDSPPATPEQPKPKPEVLPVTPPPAPQLPPAPDESVRLGIDDGPDVPTKNWQGAATPTEHLAPKSEVDSPALAITPGLPQPPSPGESGTPGDQGEQAGPPAPTADQEAPQAQDTVKPAQPEPLQDQPQQPEAKQPLPVHPKAQQPRPMQPDPAPTVEAPSPIQLPTEQPEKQQPAPQQTQPLQDKDEQTKPVQPSEPQQQSTDKPSDQQPMPAVPSVKPAAASNAPDAQPGEKAKQETWAASVVGSLVYRPGRPLAAKGLQVFTVSPRWGVATMLTCAPKNTVIRVTFGRSGKVLKAEFLDTGTGYSDVDGPLLDSVYRWTAQGELLKKVPATDPHAGLAFDIKFLLQR